MYDPCTSATGLQQLRRNQRHAVATMTVLHPAGRINDTLFIYTLPSCGAGALGSKVKCAADQHHVPTQSTIAWPVVTTTIRLRFDRRSNPIPNGVGTNFGVKGR